MQISARAVAVAVSGLLASVASAQAPTPPPSQPQTGATPGSSQTPAPNGQSSAGGSTSIPIFDDPAQNASLFDFNYGEPGSPVLPLVGVQADQITRVESVRKFGLSVLTGITSSESAPAMAIDFSPFWLLARRPISLATYRSPEFGNLGRIFARTKMAAAASRGNEVNALPSSLVFSVSSKLLSQQDPLMDDTFHNCTANGPGDYSRLTARVRQAGFDEARGNPDSPEESFLRGANAAMETLRPQLSAAYQVCAARVATELSRRPSLDVGAGFRLTGAPGHFRDLQSSGVIVWATYATGVLGGDRQGSNGLGDILGMQARGVVHARYTFSEDFYNQAGVRTGQADSALLVAGIESVPVQGQPERLRWSLQAGWNRQDAPDPASEDRNYWRFLGIARYRLSGGMWLNGTVGRVQGRGVESDTYVSIGISIAPAAASAGIDNFYRRTR